MGNFKPETLPESFRKCMAKEDRKELGATTMDEVTEKQAVIAEREQHETFINWLRLNRIFFDHQAMHKRASNRLGAPDFICLKNRLGCCVEFKFGINKLSDDQLRTKYEAGQAGVPFAVCYSVVDAIEFCRETLKV
jgi:hypothetical protein